MNVKKDVLKPEDFS